MCMPQEPLATVESFTCVFAMPETWVRSLTLAVMSDGIIFNLLAVGGVGNDAHDAAYPVSWGVVEDERSGLLVQPIHQLCDYFRPQGVQRKI